MKNPYISLGVAIVRTPYFSTSLSFPQIIKSPEFAEAIKIASPEFYDIWHSRQLTSDIQASLYKYASRAKNRCTPFGLFAGCSVVDIGDTTKIDFEADAITKYSRFDMCLIDTIINKLEHNDDIKRTLYYYPNNTIYHIYNEIRYIECNKNKSERKYGICSIEYSDYIKEILQISTNGVTIQAMVEALDNMGVDHEAASSYINELIDAQILVSELSVSMIGDNPIKVIYEKLVAKNIQTDISIYLFELTRLLKLCDELPIGKGGGLYNSLIQKVIDIGLSNDPKSIIQTDIYRHLSNNHISKDVVNELTSALDFLAILANVNDRSQIDRFKKIFTERYETEKRPLLEVLDPDIGIGYGHDVVAGENQGLLKDIPFPEFVKNIIDSESIIVGAINEATSLNSREITLPEDLLKDFRPNWKLYPPTMALHCSIIKDENNNRLIYIKNIGGSSAINTIARFSHISPAITKLNEEIAQKEKDYYSEDVIASINHWPHTRLGNVILRPSVRDYEISYIECSRSEDKTQKIYLKDIYISIVNNNIVLTSPAIDGYIIPRIDNAHSYSYSRNPIYYFLCDLQFQNHNRAMFFPTIDVAKYGFLPRIKYKNCIISVAQWHISRTDYAAFKLDNKENLLSYFNTRKIPNQIVISEHDNKLVLDIRHAEAVQIIIDYLKKNKQLIIEEDIYDSASSIIFDKTNYPYRNEFVIPIYKQEK